MDADFPGVSTKSSEGGSPEMKIESDMMLLRKFHFINNQC